MLAAAYFALANRHYRDPETGEVLPLDRDIWALECTELNLIGTGNPAAGYLAFDDRDYVHGLCRNAFEPPRGRKTYNSVIYFMPQWIDGRVHLQSSGFTLHGNNDCLEQRHPELLTCFTIPHIHVDAARQELRHLHITKSRLFPDLPSLCEEIVERIVREDTGLCGIPSSARGTTDRVGG